MKKNGSALIMVIAVTVLISALALSIVSYSKSQYTLNVNYDYNTKARFLAQSAIEKGMLYIKKNYLTLGDGSEKWETPREILTDKKFSEVEIQDRKFNVKTKLYNYDIENPRDLSMYTLVATASTADDKHSKKITAHISKKKVAILDNFYDIFTKYPLSIIKTNGEQYPIDGVKAGSSGKAYLGLYKRFINNKKDSYSIDDLEAMFYNYSNKIKSDKKGMIKLDSKGKVGYSISAFEGFENISIPNFAFYENFSRNKWELHEKDGVKFYYCLLTKDIPISDLDRVGINKYKDDFEKSYKLILSKKDISTNLTNYKKPTVAEYNRYIIITEGKFLVTKDNAGGKKNSQIWFLDSLICAAGLDYGKNKTELHIVKANNVAALDSIKNFIKDNINKVEIPNTYTNEPGSMIDCKEE